MFTRIAIPKKGDTWSPKQSWYSSDKCWGRTQLILLGVSINLMGDATDNPIGFPNNEG